MKKVCDHCNKTFDSPKSCRKFCSLDCRYAHPRSEEWRTKLAAWFGKNLSEQHCKAISAGNTGKTMSEDVCRKIAEKMLGAKNHRWNPDRVEQRARVKMAKASRNMLHRVLHDEKRDSTFSLLGYGPRELQEHIENLWQPGMSWENYGNGESDWNIDHIFPISKFPKEASPAEVNALSNLRPLWASQNFSKHNRVP